MGTDMGNAVAAKPLQYSWKLKTPSQTTHRDRVLCHNTEAKHQQCPFECTEPFSQLFKHFSTGLGTCSTLRH
jgi:hypothetical protein